MPPTNPSKPSLTRTRNQCGSETGLFFEGDRLTLLLKSIAKQIESQKNSTKKPMPEKLFIKQHFAVGINEVTRILERMGPTTETRTVTGPKQQLQAVIIASDCNPKWLTKHLPKLAGLRNVPVIFVKDGKLGSLKLGEIVRVRTSVAIGIRVKGSSINDFVRKVVEEEDQWMETD